MQHTLLERHHIPSSFVVTRADHLEAFSRHAVPALDVEQVQMDELLALLSAVKDGEVSASRSRHGIASPSIGASTITLGVMVLLGMGYQAAIAPVKVRSFHVCIGGINLMPISDTTVP